MRFVCTRAVVAVLFLSIIASAQSKHHHAQAAAAAPAESVGQMVAAANAERPLLKSIYQAPTVESLKTMHPHSRIGAMVLAAKEYEFSPQAGGTAVLAALPRNPEEMEALRQFCDADPDLTGLQRYFYGAALESLNRHPEKLSTVLNVALAFHAKEFPDDTGTGGWYCSELTKVHGAMPQQYDRAVQQAPLEQRDYLAQCGAGS